MSFVDDAERAYARAVPALLQGRVQALEGALAARPAELEERADGGDADASFILAVQATWATLPERVAQAVAAEHAPIVLPDGSSLSRDDAERQLARKEERQAHPALRASVERATAPFAASSAKLVRYFRQRGSEPRPTGGPAGATEDAARPVLAAFLRETLALRGAAREALAVLGGEPLDGPPALARALDLPDANGAFSEAACLALIAAARAVASPVRRVARVHVPRAMAGGVFVDDEARFGTPPGIARWARFSDTAAAGVAALLGATGGDVATSGTSRRRRLALAVVSSLLDAASRRRAGEAKSVAERAARVDAAATVLRARAAAALALATTNGAGEPRALELGDARELLIDALGSDPGLALTHELLAPPWLVVIDPLAHALDVVVAPSVALSLRDRFDETFALEPALWKLLRAPDGGAAIATSSTPDGKDAARAWAAFVGERL